jgi:hypothetical protein
MLFCNDAVLCIANILGDAPAAGASAAAVSSTAAEEGKA